MGIDEGQNFRESRGRVLEFKKQKDRLLYSLLRSTKFL